MKVEIEIPDKHARRLEEIAEVDPTIYDQIEVETLPQVLRLINDAHRQIRAESTSDPERDRLVGESDDPED